MSFSQVWIEISGVAYDVTKFKSEHPGGEKIIMKFAGKDSLQALRHVWQPVVGAVDERRFEGRVGTTRFLGPGV